MSEIINEAITALESKLVGKEIEFSVKFSIENEGDLVADKNGVRESSEECDCTLLADADTFKNILTGELNATSAFMTGSLKVEGSMSVAMQLGSILA